MTPEQIEQGAQALAAARTGKPIAGIPEAARPQSEADSYAIQDAVMRRLGELAGGWKVGYSPEGGVFCAPIYASKVHASPARLPASGFHVIGIECEIGFRVNQAFGPRDRPYGRDDVLPASSLHPTIEVVDLRYQDFRSLDRLQVLADNFSNGALVYGAAGSNWKGWTWCTRRSTSPQRQKTRGMHRAARRRPDHATGRAGQFCREPTRRFHRRHLRHDRHAYRTGVHRARRPYSR